MLLTESDICVTHSKDFSCRAVKVNEHGVLLIVHGVLLPKICNIAEFITPAHVRGFFIAVYKCKHL